MENWLVVLGTWRIHLGPGGSCPGTEGRNHQPDKGTTKKTPCSALDLRATLRVHRGVIPFAFLPTASGEPLGSFRNRKQLEEVCDVCDWKKENSIL